MLDYSPPLEDTTILDEYGLGKNYKAVFRQHSPEAQRNKKIKYLYSLEVLSESDSEPVLYVTSELNRFFPQPPGTHFLGVFSDLGHENCGASDDWGFKERFIKKALSITCERFNVGQSDVHR